jgi:hypothetical protein
MSAFYEEWLELDPRDIADECQAVELDSDDDDSEADHSDDDYTLYEYELRRMGVMRRW